MCIKGNCVLLDFFYGFGDISLIILRKVRDLKGKGWRLCYLVRNKGVNIGKIKNFFWIVNLLFGWR